MGKIEKWKIFNSEILVIDLLKRISQNEDWQPQLRNEIEKNEEQKANEIFTTNWEGNICRL